MGAAIYAYQRSMPRSHLTADSKSWWKQSFKPPAQPICTAPKDMDDLVCRDLTNQELEAEGPGLLD
jgi:hypothetical protein